MQASRFENQVAMTVCNLPPSRSPVLCASVPPKVPEQQAGLGLLRSSVAADTSEPPGYGLLTWWPLVHSPESSHGRRSQSVKKTAIIGDPPQRHTFLCLLRHCNIATFYVVSFQLPTPGYFYTQQSAYYIYFKKSFALFI